MRRRFVCIHGARWDLSAWAAAVRQRLKALLSALTWEERPKQPSQLPATHCCARELDTAIGRLLIDLAAAIGPDAWKFHRGCDDVALVHSCAVFVGARRPGCDSLTLAALVPTPTPRLSTPLPTGGGGQGWMRVT